MTGRRSSWRPRKGRARGAPLPGEGRPERLVIRRMAARIGAPSLIALAAALGLLALLLCALFVPGFVLRADAGTTVSTGRLTPPTLPDTIAPPFTTATAPAPAGSGAAAAATAAGAPSSGRVLATLPWGSGAGEVGLMHPVEGLTRGPEALAVAPDGRIAVLDSVNSRLVLLSGGGSFTGTISLHLAEPRFLAVDDGLLYVLDADADHTLVALDWQGADVQRTQIPALDDVVTGLFATDDGACVEVAHEDVFLVEVKDNGGESTAKQAASGAERAAAGTGRPAPAALHALAGRPVDHDLAKGAKATFRPDQGVKLKRFKVDKKSFKGVPIEAAAPGIPGGRQIEHLVSLDGDGRGGLIIGARMLRRQGDPENAPALMIGRVPGGSGQSGGTAQMTDILTLSDCSFAYLGQPYVVAPDGRIFQPVGSDAGYAIRVYSLPTSTPVQEVLP